MSNPMHLQIKLLLAKCQTVNLPISCEHILSFEVIKSKCLFQEEKWQFILKSSLTQYII